MAASSLGLSHETSFYSSPMSYFPPPIAAADGAADADPDAELSFVPRDVAGCFFPELEAVQPSGYSPVPPPVFAGRAAGENETNMQRSFLVPLYRNTGDDDAARRSLGGGGGGSAAGRIGFRTRSEVEVMDDGFRWRKYGKKAVKSSPNPRNYYRCAAEGCGVKKRVERDRDDPRYVLTTYDGVHNHATPGTHRVGAHGASPPAAPPGAFTAAAPTAGAVAWGVAPPVQLHAAATAHSSESSF